MDLLSQVTQQKTQLCLSKTTYVEQYAHINAQIFF